MDSGDASKMSTEEIAPKEENDSVKDLDEGMLVIDEGEGPSVRIQKKKATSIVETSKCDPKAKKEKTESRGEHSQTEIKREGQLATGEGSSTEKKSNVGDLQSELPIKIKTEPETSKGVKKEKDETKYYACSVCSYCTAVASRLKRHVRIHTGEKPYACKLCNYKATEGGLLKRHMRTHTGEKPFLCQLCDYRCAQAYSLHDHMVFNHNFKKPFMCDLCPYECTRPSILRGHKKKRHPNVGSSE